MVLVSGLIASFSLIILVFVIIATLVLSCVIYKNNPKSITSKVFVLLSVFVILWAVVMHFSLQSNAPKETLFLARFSLFWATGINTLFLLLSLVLPKETIQVNKKKLYGLIVVSGFVMFLTLSKYVFLRVEVKGNDTSPVPGFGMAIFAGYIIATTIASVGILVRRIRKADGLLRKQLILVLGGMSAMLGLIVATIVIPVAIFQFTVFIPFFPVYTLFFTGFTSYAIVKHKLFNTKVIATQAVTVVIWVVLFAKLVFVQDPRERVIDIVILMVVIVFGVQLIKSVVKEVEQKERLEKLTEKLKELDKQKDEFVSMAAHELRAPMTAIKGYLSMIMEGDAGEVTDKVSEYLRDAVEGNNRLIRLVNNMLNVGRIEEGRMVYQMGNMSLREVVQTIFDEFKTEAETKGLTYKLDIESDLKDVVNVDKDRIYEVVTNLLSNAIKYTDKGFVSLKLLNPGEGSVRCEVIDSGRGISQGEQIKLFQKFGRVSSSTGKTMGTGLGLFISKLLIEKFGGEIGLVSESGKGSTFWFNLPLAEH